MAEKLRIFSGWAIFPKEIFIYCESKKIEDNAKKNKMFHINLCFFIIESALLYQLHLLSLHKLLFYPPFIYIYILYDECSADVIGEYSSAKYAKEIKTLLRKLQD